VSGILGVCHLGPTPYREGLALQEALVRRCARQAQERVPASGGEDGAAGISDWLLFPDHPPVLTVGRGGSEASLRVSRSALAERGVELFEVTRGGDMTWHGPGQLVGYPIVDLSRVDRDLHAFLRALEEVLVEALAGWGLAAGRVPGRTGVWAGEEEKIASLGIAVRNWVSYHGFALNVAPDLGFFDLIHPCGLRGVRMTSLRERLGPRAPTMAAARRAVAGLLARRLGYDGVRRVPAAVVRKLACGIENVLAARPTTHHAA
jgi:lipoate-protein ligase B